MQNLEEDLLTKGYKLVSDKEVPEDTDIAQRRFFPNTKKLKNLLEKIGFQEEYIILYRFEGDKFKEKIFVKSDY